MVSDPERSSCPECGSTRSVVKSDVCKGNSGAVSVTLRGLPYLSCSDSKHTKSYVSSDFGQSFCDALFYSGSFPAAKRRGIGKIVCCNCLVPLSKGKIELGDVKETLVVKDAPSFQLEVAAPITACPECGTKQLLSTEQVSDEILSAVLEAYNSINLRADCSY